MATIEDAIAKLDQRVKDVEKGNIVRIAASTVHAQMTKRIFEEGKKTSGGKIGNYNGRDELYVDPNTLPRRVTPRGKRGKERNISNRKTTWFASYRDLRREVGRESSFVNLRLTNDLQSDFANTSVSGSDVAKNPQPHKINNSTYAILLRRDINQEKRKGLEAKYGEIFSPTQEELNLFSETCKKEFLLINAK